MELSNGSREIELMEKKIMSTCHSCGGGPCYIMILDGSVNAYCDKLECTNNVSIDKCFICHSTANTDFIYKVGYKMGNKEPLTHIYATCGPAHYKHVDKLITKETSDDMKLVCHNCQKTQVELDIEHMYLCTRCRITHYCSVECQKKDYKSHKRYCKKPV